VEAGAETVMDVVVDMEVMAEVVVVGTVLEQVTRFMVGWKPPTVDGVGFSFIPFVKSNLKPPTELVALLLVVRFN
jgi:hypothetical protein